MENFQKEKVTAKLAEYCARYAGENSTDKGVNKAANSLKGVSSATISQMLNGNWEQIKDEMWRSVAVQIGYTSGEWVTAETRDFKLINALLADALEVSNVFGAIGEAGSGKTFTIRRFARDHKRVYWLSCNDYWNKKMFLQELLSVMGIDNGGYTVGELMNEVIKTLKRQHRPIIILDEADKLSDAVFSFFISIYNQLEDEDGNLHCSMVMFATPHLRKRFTRGRALTKKGYEEIFSRMGKRFIKLKGVGSTDVRKVCLANGITEASDIKEIFEDSECDLRRVKRKIHAYKQSRKAEN